MNSVSVGLPTANVDSDAIDKDLDGLDLSMIKLKLQDEDEGLGWSSEQCDTSEKEYKRFLALKRAYPGVEIVPNRVVDSFWHQHILDTMKYAEDCEQVFGYFVHHYPYFGMNGEQDYQDLCDAFEETKALYERHFGESYGADVSMAKRCKAPKCRTQCKPMKCK